MALICLLGFGEVGQTLAADLPGPFTAWDIRPEILPAPASASAHAAVAQAEIVVCAVTAAQDEAAARSVADGMKPGTWFMDVNSASPGQKRRAAAVVEAAGGRYVEAVIMSPIAHKRLASPVLLGGPHAAAFEAQARAAGFSSARFYSEELGLASATKLCRSVMIKGIEALVTESLLAARHYGVEDAVLTSLSDFFPDQDWPQLADYLIRRGLEHGTRRAEEMREAAAAVREAGVAPVMSEAIATRQDFSAALKPALSESTLKPLLDAMRAKDARPC
jgi:3-hydroxyisobutyrate dehydrogenase-like beta-hydroxyacid dehydrogenase